MEFIRFILIGIVQGLTEFLPVSSSGHLVIFNYFLNINLPGVFFELLLHVGTVLSIFVLFYKRIISILKSVLSWKKDEDFFTGMYIIMANIPTAIIGFGFKGFFESLFSINFVLFSLFINGLIIASAAFIKESNQKLTPFKSVFIGIAQGIAIIPGISRSGSTILAALVSKIPARKAFEFSFLMSLPAICGAALLEFLKVKNEFVFNTGIFVGFIFSFLSGLLALLMLKKTVEKKKLHYFGIYCIILSVILFIFRRTVNV